MHTVLCSAVVGVKTSQCIPGCLQLFKGSPASSFAWYACYVGGAAYTACFNNAGVLSAWHCQARALGLCACSRCIICRIPKGAAVFRWCLRRSAVCSSWCALEKHIIRHSWCAYRYTRPGEVAVWQLCMVPVKLCLPACLQQGGRALLKVVFWQHWQFWLKRYRQCLLRLM